MAVLINKALIEIPPKFAGRPPVFPGLAAERMSWEGASGLAADVRAYGEWMRARAFERIGDRYPKAQLPNGDEVTVIAWIWARTVTCPNPACGIDMPLVRSWWLGHKVGKEAWVRPIIVPDASHPSAKRVDFDIGYGRVGAPTEANDGTMNRGTGTCIGCGSSADAKYIRAAAQPRGLGASLMAVVAEGVRQRVYVAPTPRQVAAANVSAPADVPADLVQAPNHDVDRLPMYGMPRWCDAFTNRQLLALTTFSDLVTEARTHVLDDSGDPAYADAVATFLGLIVSRISDYSSSISSWSSSAKNELVRNVFARQAIPMTWDFAEGNIFSNSSGMYPVMTMTVARALENLPAGGVATVAQADASKVSRDEAVISTDPPYYDNIGYSDLSDFFYVWLRRSLRSVYPDLLSTMLVPKAEELVANPYRHGGKAGARQFFEQGFRAVFTKARASALSDFPITVYYAFKQSESNEHGESSTGWETLLDGMIKGGWEITSTWPLRSEFGNRLVAKGTNALASSIVLSLRPRPEGAPTTHRRGVIAALPAELPAALRKLQQGAIAPVDLPQAAIGPGMAVFSRYSRVIEDDGSTMTVRSALARINEILDQVLNEQEGDFDNATRFAIAWYRQHGYAKGDFGAADNIARARNTSVQTMVHEGILTSAAGMVQLLAPHELPEAYDVLTDDRVGAWEVLHHLIAKLDRGGLPAAGDFLRDVDARPDAAVDVELIKELAFLLFSIAEKNAWTHDALAFNTVATAWPDIIDVARAEKAAGGRQATFDFAEGN